MPLTAHEDCLLIVVDARSRASTRPTCRPRTARAPRRRSPARCWLTALAGALSVPVVVTEEEPEQTARPTACFALPAGTPVLTKPTFGLAGTPAILDAVNATGRTTAVLVGFETDVCVFQSAVGLLDQGLRVLAVEDATFSPGEMHGRGLSRLRDAGVGLDARQGAGL